MNENEEEVVEARTATPMESRWFKYLIQLPFKSSENLTKFADKMLSLNTALIAAYIAGLKLADITISIYSFVPVIALFLSLCFTLKSVFPRAIKEQEINLAELEDGYFNGLAIRHKQISVSVILFLIGILGGSFAIIAM